MANNKGNNSKVTNTVVFEVDDTNASQTISDFSTEVNKTKEEVENLNKGLKKSKKEGKAVGNEGKKSYKAVSKEVKKTGKETKKTTKLTKLFNGGLKAIGVSLKALGIGLVVAAVALLFETLKKNQKVMDAFEIALDTVGGFVNQIVDALTDTYDKLMENKEGFDAFKKTIMGLITLALTPLKLQFYNIERVILSARLAWEESFLGSGDTETIDSLNKSLDENADNIKQAGKDAIKAGKDIKNNFGESIDFIVEGATTATDELSKVSGKAALDNAKNSVGLQSKAQLGLAQLQGSIETYDRLAEKQRQIRDDQNATYADRIEASKRLGEILDEQEEKELQLADTKVAAAKAALKNNEDNYDLQEELIVAQNERAAVEARIEGQRSEYLTSNNALMQEYQDNLKRVTDLALEGYALERQGFKDTYEEEKKLINQTIEDEEEKQRLLLEAKERYDKKLIDLEKNRIDEIAKILRTDPETKQDKEILDLENERDAKLKELEEFEATEEEKLRLVEYYKEKIDDVNKKYNKQEEEDRKKVIETNIKQTIDAVGAITDAIDAGADVQKGVAAAQALWNTYEGITTGLSAPTMAQKIAQVAFATATGFAAVKDILSTTKENAASKVGGGSVNGGGRQVNFNTVGDTRSNAELELQEDEKPTKAYVVGGEVSTQQEADRNRVKNTTFLG